MTSQFNKFFDPIKENLPSFLVSGFNLQNTSRNNTLFAIVDKDGFKDQLATLDKDFGGVISSALAEVEFKGESLEVLTVFPANASGGSYARLVIISVGEVKNINQDVLSSIGSTISAISNKLKLKSISVASVSSVKSLFGRVCYGICLGNYNYNIYFFKKKESKQVYLKEVECLVSGDVFNLEKNSVEEYRLLAEHLYLARSLVDCPPSELNPEYYAEVVKSGFESCYKERGMEIKILDESQMADLGMNSLLAVNMGSSNGARLVVVKYNGNKKSEEIDIAIVGKGVCFDSGGLSIKPANGMEDMKIDMAGSAIAFTTIALLASRKAAVNAVGVLGLVENLVSANSFKPGDILKSMSGQTIEVLNTDAEGRLVLADALYYTQKNYKPKYMIDLATLTGAVTVALADVYAAILSDEDDLVSDITEVSKFTLDKVWRLPLHQEFDKMIDSNIADMKNIGAGRGGGTVTAAQFLKRFVNCEEHKTKWAHLDIAGVAYNGKYGGPSAIKGATGFGLELLNEFIKRKLEKKLEN
jgi:leucyl aminopeptidase